MKYIHSTLGGHIYEVYTESTSEGPHASNANASEHCNVLQLFCNCAGALLQPLLARVSSVFGVVSDGSAVKLPLQDTHIKTGRHTKLRTVLFFAAAEPRTSLCITVVHL